MATLPPSYLYMAPPLSSSLLPLHGSSTPPSAWLLPLPLTSAWLLPVFLSLTFTWLYSFLCTAPPPPLTSVLLLSSALPHSCPAHSCSPVCVVGGSSRQRSGPSLSAPYLPGPVSSPASSTLVPPTPPGMLWLCPLALLMLCSSAEARSQEWYTALVHTSYTEPGSNLTVLGSAESGRYGDNSPKQSVQGLVGVPRAALTPGAPPEAQEGCAPHTDYSVPGAPEPEQPLEPWIALVARGGCSFKEKVFNADRHGAAAVVIYNEQQAGNATVAMSHTGTGDTVVIMVGYPKGMEIFEPLRSSIPVKMMITVGTRHVQEYISGQSVVFVAIAFITMMIISLAWLIFYYIQRFLYNGAQFGNQNNRKETKKAISQLQLHTVKRGEKGIDVDAENCAVCIENYKPKDVVRILPCKHVFHRICIDPWLLEHRTCPMCKLDVIKALGFWVDTEDPLDTAVPESMAGSVSAGSLSIAQEESQSEVNNLPSSSTEESEEQCHSPKEDAGETTALLDGDGSDIRQEELLSSIGNFSSH